MLIHPLNLLADTGASAWLSDNWGWVIVFSLCALALLLLGRKDIFRFSLSRSIAISSVCFRESIRKRVLWLTPLAMIAVLTITQFERALDEQQALLQTIKICIFATGLVIVLTSVIMACTSLPKEIETRVIYTVVTKPTTRFEIVLGKIIGFSRVTLTIAIIMGIFTWCFLRIRSAQKNREVAAELRDGNLSDSERARLSTYQEDGLLTARSFWTADTLQVYGDKPDPTKAFARVLGPNSNQDLLVAMTIDRERIYGPPPASGDENEWAHQGAGNLGLLIRFQTIAKRTGPASDQPAAPVSHALGPASPAAPNTQPAHLLPPVVGIAIVDENFYDLVVDNILGATTTDQMRSDIAQYVKTHGSQSQVPTSMAGSYIRLSEPDEKTGEQYAYAWLPPEEVAALFPRPMVYIRVDGLSANVDYHVGAIPIACFVPKLDSKDGFQLAQNAAQFIPPTPGPDHAPEFMTFRGRTGMRLDQQIDGGRDNKAVAVFRFLHAPSSPSIADPSQTEFQVTPIVDRSRSNFETEQDDPTILDVDVIDNDLHAITAKTSVEVENQRSSYFQVPSASLGKGHFELVLHCRSENHIVGFLADSLQLISGDDNFEWNLTKSLTIIWLMSVLVIALAIFCSTFLSWPIAIVLTLVLLVGRWGVTQLADTNNSALGRQVVNDFKFSDAAVSSVVSSSVNAMAQSLNTIAKFLPDLARFGALDSVEHGVSVANAQLLDALTVLAEFGIPALVAAYLILKNKEVAP